MAYVFAPIERLLSAVKEAIRTELAQYCPSETLTTDNMHLHTRALQGNDPRQTQIEFLLDMIRAIQMLPDSTDAEKQHQSLVLSAAVFFVTNEIASSYSWNSPWNSKTYTFLQEALGINAQKSDADKPNLTDRIRMYRALEVALRMALYEGADPLNPLLATTKIQKLISKSTLTKTADPFQLLKQVRKELGELENVVISNPKAPESLGSVARFGLLSAASRNSTDARQQQSESTQPAV